jgi:hypothetical protein
MNKARTEVGAGFFVIPTLDQPIIGPSMPGPVMLPIMGAPAGRGGGVIGGRCCIGGGGAG